MSDFLIKLEALATSMHPNSEHVSREKMSGKICLLSLKFDSNNRDKKVKFNSLLSALAKPQELVAYPLREEIFPNRKTEM